MSPRSFDTLSPAGCLTLSGPGVAGITRPEGRWRRLETSVMPRFRRLDASPDLIGASLARVVDEARHYGDPCVMPNQDSLPSPPGVGRLTSW